MGLHFVIGKRKSIFILILHFKGGMIFQFSLCQLFSRHVSEVLLVPIITWAFIVLRSDSIRGRRSDERVLRAQEIMGFDLFRTLVVLDLVILIRIR